jgi:hypothetical protein
MVVQRADCGDGRTFGAEHRKLAMLRFDARERNDVVASMHDAARASLQDDQSRAFARRAARRCAQDGNVRRRALAATFLPIGESSRGLW